MTDGNIDGMEEHCAKAFGLAAKKHLSLVMHKLETLHRSLVKKKSSSFFNLFQKSTDETYEKKAGFGKKSEGVFHFKQSWVSIFCRWGFGVADFKPPFE